jgi:hypothetical protein
MTDWKEIQTGQLIPLLRANGPQRPFSFTGRSQEIAVDDAHAVTIDGLYPIEVLPTGNHRWTNGDAKIFVSTSPEALPAVLSVELAGVGPIKDVQIDLDGLALYSGPAWVGSKNIEIPPGTSAGVWKLEIKSGTFNSGADPRPHGLLVRSIRLSRAPN